MPTDEHRKSTCTISTSSTTTLVSRRLSGRPANGSSLRPALSFDGSTLVFQSLANNLLCERKCPPALDDINLLWDVFDYDTRLGRTVRLSADGGYEWMENSRGPSSRCCRTVWWPSDRDIRSTRRYRQRRGFVCRSNRAGASLDDAPAQVKPCFTFCLLPSTLV